MVPKEGVIGVAKWRKVLRAAWCCFGVFILGGISAGFGANENICIAVSAVAVIAFWVFLIVGLVMREKDPAVIAKKERNAAKYKAVKERNKASKEYMDRMKAADKRPVEATLITTSDKTKTTKSVVSAAGRGIVGGLIAGPAGAVLGAATTRGKTSVTEQNATFFVRYESGRTGTETVKVGSARFNELAAVMK